VTGRASELFKLSRQLQRLARGERGRMNRRIACEVKRAIGEVPTPHDQRRRRTGGPERL